MGASKWTGDNPWLGLSTYQEGTHLYGRDTEVSTLMDIICNNLATIVFGRSGIGKSSLIHAGISPEIRKQGMMPIYIRFEHNTDVSYIQQVEKAICRELEKEDKLGEQIPQMGLWDFFHRNIFYDKEHKQRTPVIIIDQFEEIYTLADDSHKHLAQELFEEFADLLNNVKPSKVLAYEAEATKFTKSKISMGDDDVLTFRVHSAKRLNYIENSNFHLVICLREDYLYYLERNTSKIPSFKINRFSLQALNRQSALDVILLPCPGLFDNKGADEIISKIATYNDEGNEEIDPTILSIFLFKYYNRKGKVKTENIIDEFYADETKHISRSSLAYLEDHLITGEGFRHFLPYNDALSNGVKESELKQLIASRIITFETRKKHQYIEFSHDVICPIAKAHRAQRRIDEQARKLRKRIFMATALVVVAIILIGSFFYLDYELKESESSLQISKTKNASIRSHYMIVQGDVLDAIRVLLNTVPQDMNAILPETEKALNEAYDSLYANYACIAILEHLDDVTTAEYSEDTKYIVTACNDGICRIWNSSSGEELYKFDSKTKYMTGASMNKEGNRVIMSFHNGSALIWDLPSGNIVSTLKGHTSAVNYACFSPNGQYALTASKDKTVRLWNAKTGKYLKTIVEHTDNVNCALFSNDGTKVITSSEDGTSVVYDLKSKTSKVVFSNTDISVEYAEFNYDDTQIAIVTADAVHILNAETAKPINSLRGHDDMISSASFSPDGHSIVTSSHDKTLKLWNINTGEIIHSFTGHSNVVRDVVFSPDGQSVLSTSSDNEARIWNTVTQEARKVIPSDLGILASATYSPNGRYIAAISLKGKAKIWNADTQKVISTFNIPDEANSIVFNSKSNKVVVASDGNIVRVFDVSSGQLIDSVEVANGVSYDYAMFTPDDKSIIAFSRENRTKQHKLNGVSSLFLLDSLTSVSFGQDNKTCLLSRYNNPSFSNWDFSQKKIIQTFDGHSNGVCSVKYSHDKKRVISGSSDNTAIIWNVETGDIIHKLKKHSSQVYFADFSNDDNYAITASTDGKVKLWNTKTGNDVATREAKRSSTYTYMFNPKSSQYIIAGDKDICIYKLFVPNDLILKFKSRYKKVEFSEEEKEYYSLK